VISRRRKLAAVLSLVGASSIGAGIWASPAAHAFTGDTDDSLSSPGTIETVLNSGNVVVMVNTGTGFGTITITCTSFGARFTVPSSGLGASLAAAPTFSGCTDSFGGTDTFTNSGTWKIKFKDTSSAETSETNNTEPNSGDRFLFNVPANGETIQSTALPGCSVTNPALFKIKGAYDDMGNGSVTTSFSAPLTQTGCGGGTWTEVTNNGNFVLSTAIHDLS
jgi:hypothetical protein